MARTNLGTERHGEVAPALARRSVSQVDLSLACVTDTTHTHRSCCACVDGRQTSLERVFSQKFGRGGITRGVRDDVILGEWVLRVLSRHSVTLSIIPRPAL